MFDRIINAIKGNPERVLDATAADIPHQTTQSITGIEDATKHPEDIEGEYMKLILPEDVKTEPTQEELHILLQRMNKTSAELDKQRNRGAYLEGHTRTDPGPIDEEYGGTCILIALDTEHLDHDSIIINSRDNSDALPEVENLYEDVPNPTLIPPIFMKAEVLVGREKKSLNIQDGNHRAWVAKRDKSQPFLLAYIPKEDLEFLDEDKIVYRKVKDIMDEIPPS